MVYDNPLAGKKLDIAYWYVSNRFLLKKIFFYFFSSVILGLIFLYTYIVILNLVVYRDYYNYTLNYFITNNQDYEVLRGVKLPQKIEIISINTYGNIDDKTDIIAQVRNNRTDWWASFYYQFQVAGKLAEKKKSFILPGETKYLSNLATPNVSGDVNLLITDYVWQKQIDYPEFAQKRFQLEFQNIDFISSRDLGIGNELEVSRVTFDLYNGSPYNYANINMLVLLKTSSGIVAVSQSSSGEINSGETKALISPFYKSLPQITSIDIVPEINILDDSVYLDF